MKINYISFRYFITRLAVPALSVMMLWSCSKTVDEPTAAINSPSSLDENAGKWKPYVLSSSEEIAVAQPNEATSDDYKAELKKLKEATDAVPPNNASKLTIGEQGPYTAGTK